ncbi:12653_t:CDS:2 [Funneliformis mosseae]|uniref:12653_t:CDS:1 n=1 Tax=Funneliformis mosseae TaxID=27381 RepID=A0A9N9A1M5_FUNMO|nr:12653_t:CDS:2 [Funneliformis mosseae]
MNFLDKISIYQHCQVYYYHCALAGSFAGSLAGSFAGGSGAFAGSFAGGSGAFAGSFAGCLAGSLAGSFSCGIGKGKASLLFISDKKFLDSFRLIPRLENAES